MRYVLIKRRYKKVWFREGRTCIMAPMVNKPSGYKQKIYIEKKANVYLMHKSSSDLVQVLP